MSSAKRTKLVVRKTSPVTKAAIVTAAILSVVAIVALYGSIDSLRNQYDALRDDALALESDNAALKDNIEDLGSLESALRIAMEELVLTFPDSLIFAPNE